MPDPEWYNTPEKRERVNAMRADRERVRAEEARAAWHRRLLVVEQKLEALGLPLDDLIELLDARSNGEY